MKITDLFGAGERVINQDNVFRSIVQTSKHLVNMNW